MPRHTNNIRTSRILRAISWSAAGTLVQSISQLLVLLILARILSPSDFGIAALCLTVVALSEIFVQLGVGPALIQKKEISQNTIGTAQSITYALGILTTAAIFLSSDAIAKFFNNPELNQYIQLSSSIFLIQCSVIVQESLLIRELKFKRLAIATCTSQIAGYAIPTLLFAYLGWGAYSIVFGTILKTLLRSILIGIYGAYHLPTFCTQEAKELMNFGTGFSIARILNYCANQADKIVIGKTLGVATLGVYDRSKQLIELITQFFTKSVDQVLFSTMAASQDHQERLQELFLRSLAYTLFICIPLGALLATNAEAVIQVVLGPNWSEANAILLVLALSLAPRIAYRISDSLARATGAVYRRAWIQGVFAILVTALTYIGHTKGLSGATIGAATAICANYVLMLALSKRITRASIRSILAAHVPGILAATLYLAGVYATNGSSLATELGVLLRLAVHGLWLVATSVITIALHTSVLRYEPIASAAKFIYSKYK